MERPERRKRVVERHIRMENAHDLEGILSTFGEDCRYDDQPWDEHHRGRRAVEAYYESLLRAAPDLRVDVVHRHLAGDAVVLELVVSGTHRGAWRGFLPTGSRFSLPLCAVYTFTDDDRVAGKRVFYDRALLFRQLGIFREPTRPLGRLVTPMFHPMTTMRIAANALASFGQTAKAPARSSAKPRAKNGPARRGRRPRRARGS